MIKMVSLKHCCSKELKIPNHWSAVLPKKYKQNAIQGDLHNAREI